MARIRYLKPDFFKDSKLSKIGPFARLFFQGLWCQADREGQLEDDPEKLNFEIIPYDFHAGKVNAEILLRELHSSGFILRYEAAGKRYIQIKNFMKHQKPHHTEKHSLISPPKPQKDGETPKLDGEKKEGMEKGMGMEKGSVQQAPSPEALGLAELLKSLILVNNPKANLPPSLNGWALEADRMVKLDGRTKDEIKQVIEFSQKDGFWMANILSMSKLRKQFDQLWIKMNQNGQTGKTKYHPSNLI